MSSKSTDGLDVVQFHRLLRNWFWHSSCPILAPDAIAYAFWKKNAFNENWLLKFADSIPHSPQISSNFGCIFVVGRLSNAIDSDRFPCDGLWTQGDRWDRHFVVHMCLDSCNKSKQNKASSWLCGFVFGFWINMAEMCNARLAELDFNKYLIPSRLLFGQFAANNKIIRRSKWIEFYVVRCPHPTSESAQRMIKSS